MRFICAHDWSWPRKRMAISGWQCGTCVKMPPRCEFDCTQTCVKCGKERLYDFQKMTAGKVIERKVRAA